MFSPVLEVAISLAFIYLIFSLIVSWINEFITSRLATRGKYLRKQLSAALDDQHNKNWAELLYVHPTVDLLAKRERRPPAYIPGSLFATGLIDLITNEARIVKYSQNAAGKVLLEESLPHQQPINNFNAGLQKLNKSDVKILLQTFLDNSDGDFEKLKTNLVTWYDDYMDRVSGWYKKRIRGWLFLIGLAVAIAFNVDTIRLVTAFWKNASLRESVVKAADAYIAAADKPTQAAKSPPPPPADSLRVDSTVTVTDSTQSRETIHQLAQRIDSVYWEMKVLNIPIGYTCTCVSDSTKKDTLQHTVGANARPATDSTSTTASAPLKQQSVPVESQGYFTTIACAIRQWWAQINFATLVGWLLTAGALSFGAPFWFDVLKKFVNVRSAGIKPEKVNTEDLKQ